MYLLEVRLTVRETVVPRGRQPALRDLADRAVSSGLIFRLICEKSPNLAGSVIDRIRGNSYQTAASITLIHA